MESCYSKKASYSAPRVPKRYINQGRQVSDERLVQDYFAEEPIYGADMFRRQFRMHRPLFLRIVEAVSTVDPYFQQRQDTLGRLGLLALQKYTVKMRVLAYGSVADVIGEYLRIAESTTRHALVKFVDGVTPCFGIKFLRKPNEQDLALLLQVAEQRGFPGMIGSIDCMHWKWKNCLIAWCRQYARKSGKPTIILEGVASYDLWIWHTFFGTPGTYNDINVLQQSPIFTDVLKGRAPIVRYTINGTLRELPYYLIDGIYSKWATFVKSVTAPSTRKLKMFVERQEGYRKDVEKAFGVLQASFAFIKNPCLLWNEEFIGKIMIACIIMHNIIVEDERDGYGLYCPEEFVDDRLGTSTSTNYEYSTERIGSLSRFMTADA